MPYVSSFLYRFERGVSMALAVAATFQSCSLSFWTMNVRSDASLNS